MTKVRRGIYEVLSARTMDGVDQMIGRNVANYECGQKVRAFFDLVRKTLDARGSIKGHRVRVKSVWTPGYARIPNHDEPVIGYLWDLTFTVDKRGLDPKLNREASSHCFLHVATCSVQKQREDRMKNLSGIVEVYSDCEGTDPMVTYFDFVPVQVPYDHWVEE